MRKEVTYVVPSNHTVHELHHPNQHQKRHEHVQQQGSCRRVVEVLVPDVGGDLGEGRAGLKTR